MGQTILMDRYLWPMGGNRWLSSPLIRIVDVEGVVAQQLYLCIKIVKALNVHFQSPFPIICSFLQTSAGQVTVMLTLKSCPWTNLEMTGALFSVRTINLQCPCSSSIIVHHFPSLNLHPFIPCHPNKRHPRHSFFLRACACGPSTL